jgi:chromosomal replication initiation ATPase DnaA
MTVERQLPLAFEHRPSLEGDDFLVAPPNADAVRWLDRWPDWPAPALILYGPPASGKTHLARVFLARSGGLLLSTAELADDPSAVARGPAPAGVFEDAEGLLAAGQAEALLHFYNSMAEAGRQLLLTALRPPNRWAVALPDLRSRLLAAPAVAIGPPDDTLIAQVLVKLFRDRQLVVEPDVIPYMLGRMERSFEAARALVAALDSAGLAAKRRITVPLVRDVMTAFGPPDAE